MPNPTKFTWTDPTTNVDGSPVTAGEITGYTIGIRSTTVAGSTAGVYPINVPVSGATAASELLSQISPSLAPDTYAAAIQTNGPTNSVFSSEITFTIAAPPLPVPKAPTGFSVA
jgi:hypothetical protein